jgi:undecaprenol kinase/diacylglycerol kinase (ATP)
LLIAPGDAPVEGPATFHIEHAPHDEPPQRRRSAWRQTLVQAERGLVGGFRSGSALFVHFFGISIVIAAALVLGIEWTHWIGIAGCLTLVLTAEMFNQALKALASADDRPATLQVQRALAIGTAAVLVSCVGSTVILTLIFWQRFQQLFAG